MAALTQPPAPDDAPSARVVIVGLGPGDPQHLTAAARHALDAVEVVHVRTARHPAVQALLAGRRFVACDDLYEAGLTFDAVYDAIAERLLEAARLGPIVYAVPGDPSVGETSVRRLRAAAEAAGIRTTSVPGVSFIGPTLDLLGWDALDGLQLADATALAARHHPDLDPDRPALVAQLYGRLVASDVKLVLLNQYPDDHPVTLVSGAATSSPRVATLPLHALDRRDDLDDLTTLAVPPLAHARGSLLTLADVVARLRAPDGCPWDREQTHASLRPYLLEEAHEALDALDAGDAAALGDELGDLLLQVVLHAQIAVEEGDFSLADVVRGITEKLIRRHPHVFGDVQAVTSAAVVANWEALKAEERAERGQAADPLAGVPRGLPALARAQAILRKGRRAGEPAQTADPAADLAAAAARLGADPSMAPLGDLLLAAVRLAVAHELDAESALREATARQAAGMPPSEHAEGDAT